MPAHTISIWMDFDLMDRVRHKEHGEGIIVQYAATRRARGSECIQHAADDMYYIVSFDRKWIKCAPADLELIEESKESTSDRGDNANKEQTPDLHSRPTASR